MDEIVWGVWVESWRAPYTYCVKQRENTLQETESAGAAENRNRREWGPDAKEKKNSAGRL